MMLPSTELLLLTALVGLYLYDSTVLLHCNEGLLSPRRGGDWSVRFGSDTYQVGGREPCIPNPLLPHRPVLRLTWSDVGEKSAQPWCPPQQTFGPLGTLIWAMGVALFLFLPLGLLTRLGDYMIIASLATFYLSAFAALAWVWRHRDYLQMTPKTFAKLSFESLTCPPFALNLIRHITITWSPTDDLMAVARAVQSPERWARTRVQLMRRLESSMAWTDETSERHSRMRMYYQQLAEEDTR